MSVYHIRFLCKSLVESVLEPSTLANEMEEHIQGVSEISQGYLLPCAADLNHLKVSVY